MTRHRIVLDTNVIISAILFGGDPRRVLELVITSAIDCTLSLSILDELRDVLQRSKFGFSIEQCLQITEELHGICEIIQPTTKYRGKISDPDDKIILECAIEADADFIITGDSDLLDLKQCRNIQILNPSEFINLLKVPK